MADDDRAVVDRPLRARRAVPGDLAVGEPVDIAEMEPRALAARPEAEEGAVEPAARGARDLLDEARRRRFLQYLRRRRLELLLADRVEMDEAAHLLAPEPALPPFRRRAGADVADPLGVGRRAEGALELGVDVGREQLRHRPRGEADIGDPAVRRRRLVGPEQDERPDLVDEAPERGGVRRREDEVPDQPVAGDVAEHHSLEIVAVDRHRPVLPGLPRRRISRAGGGARCRRTAPRPAILRPGEDSSPCLPAAAVKAAAAAVKAAAAAWSAAALAPPPPAGASPPAGLASPPPLPAERFLDLAHRLREIAEQPALLLAPVLVPAERLDVQMLGGLEEAVLVVELVPGRSAFRQLEDRLEDVRQLAPEEFRIFLRIAVELGDHLQEPVVDDEHPGEMDDLGLAQRAVDLGLDMVGEHFLQLLKLRQRFRILLQRHGHVQCGDHRTLLLLPSGRPGASDATPCAARWLVISPIPFGAARGHAPTRPKSHRPGAKSISGMMDLPSLEGGER